MTAIPLHMSHLRVHGGLPVPAVVCPRDARTGLVRAYEYGGTMKTVCVSDSDVPDFAKYDDEKLRRCITKKRCHVCDGQPHPMLLCLPKLNDALEGSSAVIGGKRCPLVVQPWVCAACLRFACEKCPPLSRAIREGRGLVGFVTKHRLVTTFWKPATADDPIPDPGHKVVSMIKIAIERATWTPLPEWARRNSA